MGNRAVIAFENMPDVGIYLHWNGGPESVLAFLTVAKERGFRLEDSTYGYARLIALIAEFFDSDEGDEGGVYRYRTTLSLGAGPLSSLNDGDVGDNGIYWIGPEWTVSRREFGHVLWSQVKDVDKLTKPLRFTHDAIVERLQKNWKVEWSER